MIPVAGPCGALSFAQQRLWFLNQLAPEQPGYLITRAFKLTGPLDADLLERSLRHVLARHDVLLSRIEVRDGEPVASYIPARAVPLGRIGLGPAADGPERAVALLRDLARQPCDLAGPLLRATVIRLGDRRFLFQYTVHHIVFDGPSRVIFERELSAAYAALAAGRPPRLPPVAVRYADHVARERAAVARGELAGQETYWRERLADATVLDWPADRRRPAEPSAAAQQPVTVAPDVHARLAALAAAERTSVFVVALAAYQYLLGRMSGASDVLVGVPFAGRTEPELEEVIGFFTNTAVLRADLGGSPSLRDLVRQARTSVLDALDNQEVPFERVISALGLERDGHRNPLFQHWFGFLDGELAGGRLELPGITCTPIEHPVTTARFDTEMEIGVSGGALAGDLVYATGLFDPVTIERFAERYPTLLAEGSRRPETPMSSIDLVGAAERSELLGLGAGVRPAAVRRSLAQWLDERIAQVPGAAAVADGSTELTYWQLGQAAARLAGRLRDAGAGPGSVVGIHLPRSAEMIVALVATIMAGAAYLPVGTDLPAERAEYLLAEAGAVAVLTRQADLASIPAAPSVRAVLAVDGTGGSPSRAALTATDGQPQADRLLYVLYTSGSTGRPKGVAISHWQFGELVRWHLDRYPVWPGDRVAQVASLSFDAAGWEIWPALLAGASLVICPDEQVRDPVGLAAWLAAQRITMAFAPTPVAEQLIRERLGDGTPLRCLLTGGDVFRPRPGDSPGVPVINHYGPTESTVVATASGPLGPPWADNSIGRPISGVRGYLVDGGLRLAPRGVTGELCLGGTGVAWGYWRRPALTAERFVPDPFAVTPGARMYRTGDLARWRPDGTLHYAGRMDGQLEVNGCRIEPAEVEAELLAQPSVRAAVVTTGTAASGRPVLVGYLVPDGELPPPDELRASLARRLPRYLIPQAFVPLAQLPVTASGKVDRARLPAPEAALADPVAPRTDAERGMARLWSEVLGVSAIGVHDDFFTLGGDSMLAARLLNRIRAMFDVDFAMRGIFDHPSLAELSAAVTGQLRAQIASMSGAQIAAALGDRAGSR